MTYTGVTKTLICRGCSHEYTATSTGRLPQWCIPECKKANGPRCKVCGGRAKSIGLCPKHWHQRKRHGGDVAPRTCKQCGKPYQESASGRGKARATCSETCREERNSALHRARLDRLNQTHCSVDECDLPIRSSGAIWCEMHYVRVRQQGKPGEAASRVGRSGEEHHAWAGDEIGYRAAHNRIERLRGIASSHSCVDCGDRAEHWSYNHSGVKERWGYANGCYLPYSTDVHAYDARCRTCHRAFDGRQKHGVVNLEP